MPPFFMEKNLMQITIQQALISAFEDFRLDRNERGSLLDWLDAHALKPADYSYVRNQAFSLVVDYCREDGARSAEAVKWLHQVVKAIDGGKDKDLHSENQAFFSPGTACKAAIIRLLDSATREIFICVFTISDDEISQAILDAHDRGVKLKIISDNDKADDKGNDIYRMQQQGVNIRLDKTPNHMHHKFAIVDAQHLINGSFNWTRSASRYNEENIVVSDDSNLVKDFSENFHQLWSKCSPLIH